VIESSREVSTLSPAEGLSPSEREAVSPAHANERRDNSLTLPKARFHEVRRILVKDLYRYSGDTRIASFMKHFLFTPGFKYTVWMRLAGWLKQGSVSRILAYPIVKFVLLHCRYKYGIAIPEQALIGPGLFINRFGGIYIHHDVVIGKNCNITHGVVLGRANAGSKAGSPTIGDRVFLGTGAKVIGRVSVGDDAAIGANALVVDDVPASAVMAAPAAQMISQRGSGAYINRQI
jgi:serine O-acetyltransferase